MDGWNGPIWCVEAQRGIEIGQALAKAKIAYRVEVESTQRYLTALYSFANGYTANVTFFSDGAMDVCILVDGHIDSFATEYEPALFHETVESAVKHILSSIAVLEKPMTKEEQAAVGRMMVEAAMEELGVRDGEIARRIIKAVIAAHQIKKAEEARKNDLVEVSAHEAVATAFWGLAYAASKEVQRCTDLASNKTDA